MHMKELNDFLFWHLYVQNTQERSDFPSYSQGRNPSVSLLNEPFYLEDVYLILDCLTL